MVNRRTQLTLWAIAGLVTAALGLWIATGDLTVTAAWSWRSPWRTVQALVSDRPEKPWNWVERLSWLVAIAFAIPSLVLAAKALKAARQSPAPSTPIIAASAAAAGLASIRVPLVQPGGALTGADTVVLGRDQLVDNLRRLTRPPHFLGQLPWRSRTEQRMVVLHGGGGVGKSTVAWRLATTVPETTTVWWVSATGAEQLRSQLREVAAAAGATEAQLHLAWSGRRDPAELLWTVLATMQHQWLLVIDDANTPQYLAGPDGHVADGRGWLRPRPATA